MFTQYLINYLVLSENSPPDSTTKMLGELFDLERPLLEGSLQTRHGEVGPHLTGNQALDLDAAARLEARLHRPNGPVDRELLHDPRDGR